MASRTLAKKKPAVVVSAVYGISKNPCIHFNEIATADAMKTDIVLVSTRRAGPFVSTTAMLTPWEKTHADDFPLRINRVNAFGLRFKIFVFMVRIWTQQCSFHSFSSHAFTHLVPFHLIRFSRIARIHRSAFAPSTRHCHVSPLQCSVLVCPSGK